MKQKDKRESHPSLSWSVSSRRYFHTSPSPREDRAERDNDTDGLFRESEAIGPSTHGLTLLTRYVTASHPEADPIGCVITGCRDSRRSRRAALVKQQRALSLEYEGRQDRREEKRRDREREDCEASRRWSALDLASVRSLAGPSCSPVLICFLLPSRLPTVPLRRSLPRPSPPCSGKGGFRSPPVS